MITGAYSVASQAAQLGYLPRLRIAHTSESTIGQIYGPWINWLLMVSVLTLVFAFGMAVTGTITEGRAVVIATHDVEFAARAADRVVVLAEGDIVADGPTAEVIVASPVFAPQTAKILAPSPFLTVDQVRPLLDRDGDGQSHGDGESGS